MRHIRCSWCDGRRPVSRWPAGFVLLLLLAACDREAPTSPDAAAQIGELVPNSSLTAADTAGWPPARVIGRVEVPVPPDNDWSRTDWLRWWPTGIVIGSGWTYVRVEGGLDYTWNPECANVPAHLGQCGGTPGEEGTSGAWDALGSLAIGWAAPGSSWIEEVPAQSMFGLAEDPLTAGVLLYRGRRTAFHVVRRMQLGGGGSPSASIGVPQYLLSGGQTLTVEDVGEPVRVAAPAMILKGDSVTASLAVRPPFRLLDRPGYPERSIAWRFTPVDSEDRAGSSYYLHACTGQTRCDHLPAQDGMFAVSTSVEGVRAMVSSNIVRIVEPELELTCRAPAGESRVRNGDPAPEVRITRGESLDCSAGTYPAGAAVRVLQWSFAGADGYSRSANEDEIGPAWAGPVAAGGRVTLLADVRGEEQTASIDISVLPRDWSDQRVSLAVRPAPAGHDRTLHPRPRGDRDLGGTVFQASALRAVVEIEGGPNRGLGYLSSVPFAVEALLVLNDVALRRGSEFYELQDPDRPGAKSAQAGRSWCTRSTVPGLASQVLPHEGSPYDDGGSHTSAYQRELDSRVSGAAAQLESIVSESPEQMEAAYVGTLAEIHAAAADAARAVHDPGADRWLAPVDANGAPCTLRFFSFD